MKIVKCNECGKIAIIQVDSACPTKCCGEAMTELVPGAVDGALEKHVPAVTAQGSRIHAVIGEVEHPMLDAHFINFILLETEGGYQVKSLKPGDKPEADFIVADGDKAVAVYEYCNLHGLWKKEL